MVDLLKVKKEKKSNNPKFIRQDIHKKKRLHSVWRKARGCDSKKRLAKNNRIRVKPGYGTPNKIRDLDMNGREIVLINKIEDISSIDPKNQIVILSKKTGLKNKLIMIAELIKKKIEIYNLKDPEKYIEEQNSKRLAKKKVKKEVVSEKKLKKQEKTTETKQSIEDKLSDEEKKKLEKKEIDKLLTKKF